MRISQNKPWLRIFSLTIGVLLLLSGPSFAGRSVLNDTELIVAQPDTTGVGTLLKVSTDGRLSLQNSLSEAGVDGLTGEAGVSVNGIAATININAVHDYLVTQKAVYDYVAQVVASLSEGNASARTIPIGMIAPFGGDAPDGWLECDGAEYNQVTYSELYAVIADSFGETTFGFYVPDLRGRTAIGAGTGEYPDTTLLTTRSIGEKVGSENITLTEAQLPAHSHKLPQTNVSFNAGSGSSVSAYGVLSLSASITETEVSPTPTAVNIMPPSLVVKYYIYSGVVL